MSKDSEMNEISMTRKWVFPPTNTPWGRLDQCLKFEEGKVGDAMEAITGMSM